MSDLKKELENALKIRTKDSTLYFYKCCYDTLFEDIFYIANRFSKANTEDIMQDYFEKILKIDIGKFEQHKDYIDRYLLKVAYNLFNDYYKKNSIILREIIESDSIIGSNNITDKENISKLFTKEGYDKLLSEDQNLAMKMKIEGYPYKDIAEKMNKTEGAVKNLIFRAKRILRDKMLS